MGVPCSVIHGPAALIGSVGALVLVWWLGQRDWLIDPVAMVLVGVVISVMLGAATVFVHLPLLLAGVALHETDRFDEAEAPLLEAQTRLPDDPRPVAQLVRNAVALGAR